MRFYSFFLLFWVGFSIQTTAQDSLWYRYDLTYYKIQTAAAGIYRIPVSSLTALGIPLKRVDPRHLRLYHRGKEVAVWVEGEQDGRLDSQDYLDFLGVKNEGALDQHLYLQGLDLPNPYTNTYSDTTAFFLVYTPGERGKRMDLRVLPAANLPLASSFRIEDLQVFANQYSFGKSHRWAVRSPAFEEGEGWMSPVLFPGVNLEFSLGPYPITEGEGLSLELGWVGRSDQLHDPQIWLGTATTVLLSLPSPIFSGFESFRQSIPLSYTDIGDGKIQLYLAPKEEAKGDYFSMAFAKLSYHLPLRAAKNDGTPIFFPATPLQAKIGVVAEPFIAYEGEDTYSLQKIALSQYGDSLCFQAGISERESELWLLPEKQVVLVKELQPIRFRDYRALAASYLLVGHRQLDKPTRQHTNPLQAYASYRASTEGGSHDTLVLRMEELYDQFAFGERTPWALKAFLKFYWPIHRPQYLLLTGRSIAPFSQVWVENASVFQRNAPQSFEFQDLVPTVGFPASDSHFVKELNPREPELSAMAVGRIPSKTSQDLSNYLDKVIEKERSLVQGPQRILHLVGGMNPAELARHSSFLTGFAGLAQNRSPEVEVITYTKESATEVQRIDLGEDINAGVTLLTYFGHGSLGYNELDFGYVSDSTLSYANQGKYPMLLINGCEYSNAFGPSYSQGEDWLVSQKKGAIAVLSTSSLGVDLLLKRYTEIWYKYLFAFESAEDQLSLGGIMLRAEREFTIRYGLSPEHQAHLAQQVLFGDPALRIFLGKRK
ncbi:MAG: C25 family cysteine peptidase [Bacteroidetes bacterium]|nr:C25 family cysteine peptidase [Bacteroidota bacterium]